MRGSFKGSLLEGVPFKGPGKGHMDVEFRGLGFGGFRGVEFRGFEPGFWFRGVGVCKLYPRPSLQCRIRGLSKLAMNKVDSRAIPTRVIQKHENITMILPRVPITFIHYVLFGEWQEITGARISNRKQDGPYCIQPGPARSLVLINISTLELPA